MKKTLIFIFFSLFAVCISAQSQTAKHEVMTGETLYSIARTYGTSVNELLRLNPSLNPDVVMAGQKIIVPVSDGTKPAYTIDIPQTSRGKYKTTHEVKKKETIYSISRMYDITEEQLVAANPELSKGKVKKGAILNIPYTDAENKAHEEELAKAKRIAEEHFRQAEILKNTINVAVILPFSLSSDDMTVETQKVANLYQGFLMAADTLKHQGYHINVYAYDESSQDIYGILNKPMMKNMSLIIGPTRHGGISAVADFAKDNGITHVVPLSNDAKLLDNHPNTFQVNSSSSLLNPLAASRFVNLHRSDNIVIVSTNESTDNDGFTLELKKACVSANLPYQVVSLYELSNMSELLRSDKLNVIVPTASSATVFSSICARLESMDIPSDKRIQLFGQPEWLVLPSKMRDNLVKYNCQFFTSFFHNAYSSNTQSFESNFARWFHQQQYPGMPRYGELGFDIGMFFLKGLKKHGKEFINNASSLSQQSLEFPMQFVRNNEWSGWHNKALQIVTYKSDGSVSLR